MEKQLIETVAPHHAEVSLNAKGELTCSVKVYAEDEADAATRAVAALLLLRAAAIKAGLRLAGGGQ